MTSHIRKLTHIRGFVTFIDIIGFTDLIKSRQRRQKLDQLVNAIDFRVRSDGRNYPDLNYIFISDTLVIFCEEDNFSDLINKTCQVQNAILKRGLLTRGALTYGQTYFLSDPGHDTKGSIRKGVGTNIFGKAYVEAYKLHQQHSKYPRVVISDKAFEVASRRRSNEETLGYLTAKDRDGWNIVCQFGRQINGLGYFADRKAEAKKTISELADVIERNCKLYEADQIKREKWYWIKNHLSEQQQLSKKLRKG